MLWRAVHGLATLGDLALFYQAFSRGQALMRTLLGSVGQIYTHTLFLGNLFAFIDTKPEVVDPPRPEPVPDPVVRGIALEGVTFRYPGSARPALERFDAFLPAGKVVAIVGPNGAGKSTLVKLLCRFYDPESGRITVDGVDLRDFAVEDLRRAITVLFQFPLNYHATARDCIALGEPDGAAGAADVEAAARAAGAHEFVSGLPAGYETQLGKWFADGVELSGGEWQRIAMARAYLKRSPIILLDEPTSFMDSWAEADWFERFRGLAEGRTALLITHRLSIAMRADVIMVLDDGAVAESGTHAELVERGGLYARSWAAQVWAAEAATDAAYGRANGTVS
jgi:ATP-binding cassette subfamily B protein